MTPAAAFIDLAQLVAGDFWDFARDAAQ